MAHICKCRFFFVPLRPTFYGHMRKHACTRKKVKKQKR